MKIHIVSIFIVLIMSACAFADDNHSEQSEKQEKYRTGQITKTELKTYEQFFAHHIKDTSEEDIALLQSIDDTVIITTYFGLWCHDSKREVPRLIDLLEAANNKNIIHRLIALDLNKKEPFGRQEEDAVLFTPTIILKKKDKEIGRIVEKPIDSLAQDIVSFLEKD